GSQQGDWEQGRYHWELQVQPWVEPRAGTVGQATSPGTAWLAELQLGSQQGDWEQGRYHWELQVQPWVEPRAGTVGQA
ncbi:hypothetical protein C7E18_23620, partial [Stenotrophomonas maltophilia]